MMCFSNRVLALAAALGFVGSATFVHAAPYASGISVSGTTVNYIMNQDSDVLEISINGGAFAPAPDGLLKGAHTFTLGAPTDTFAIRAEKTELGFTTASGGTIVKAPLGMAYDVPEANGTQMSTDADVLNHYNSPRGLDVSKNPNSPNFGMAYISNSAAGTPTGRSLGDGIYVLKADQSDGFGYGDTAQQTATFGAAATANTPYKLTVAGSGEVYVTGFGDAISGVWRYRRTFRR